VSELLSDLGDVFSILRKYKLPLNASKCSFGVSSRKFLGYIITHQGIDVNPDQIRVINDLHPPRNPKEMQRLIGMTIALNRFLSLSADCCRSYFQLLHKWKDFMWTKECNRNFEELKKYLVHPPIRSKPEKEKVMNAYIAITNHAISPILVRTDSREWCRRPSIT